MESNAYEEISDDDSTYHYEQLEDREYKNEEEENFEKWDDYFLNDYKFELFRIAEEFEDTEQFNINLPQEQIIPDLPIVEDRLTIISRLQKLSVEKKHLKLKNSFLHKKCRDLFIKSKIMNYLERWSFDSDIHEDKRYIEILKDFKAMKIRKEKAEEYYSAELKMIEDAYELKCSEFQVIFREFTSREFEIGIASIDRGTKKNTVASVVELLNKQKQRLTILSQVTIKYLKLKHLLKHIYNKFNERNILGEGHTIMKYENLMTMKNMSLETIDEREKDLEIIRDNLFSIVHMLAHLREVSSGIEENVTEAAMQLEDLENIRRKKRAEFVEKNQQRNLLDKQIMKIKHK